MPFVTDTFKPVTVGGPAPPAHGPVLPADTTRQLQQELAAVGMPVAGAEAGATPQFGPATSDRLKQFQELYGLTTDGFLNPTTGGVLALASIVAAGTDVATLRTALRGAKGKVAASPEFNRQLARYQIAAHDYAAAADVLTTSGLSAVEVHGILGDLLGDNATFPPVPQAPEIPFPENYYSYRRDLYPLDLLNRSRFRFRASRKRRGIRIRRTRPISVRMVTAARC